MKLLCALLPLCAAAASAPPALAWTGAAADGTGLGGYVAAYANGGYVPRAPLYAVPEGCPKKTAGPETEPAVREVSEVDGALLPPPKDDLDRESLLNVLRINLDYWNGRPDSAYISIGGRVFDAARLRRTNAALIEMLSAPMPEAELLKAIKQRFLVFRASADDGSGKTVLTGYYEAELEVSRERDAAHPYPLYLRPSDLVKTGPAHGVDFDYGRYEEGRLVPYHTSAEIYGGALAGRGLEFAWTAHPAHIMLLQIQGSGVLRLPGGDYFRAGFDGANGRPFGSVQRALMDCGEIKAMSFKDFIAYLTAQPGGREERLVSLNQRYIFFKERPKDSLPYGAIGRALTPGRSIAVDPQHVPLGLPGFVKSRRPVAAGAGLQFADFSRFIATQDTGSAIRGPGRLDLFWGSGAAAETEASSMKAPGELFLFVLK